MNSVATPTVLKSVTEGGEDPVVIGFDVVLLAVARIRNVYGFLDEVPG